MADEFQVGSGSWWDTSRNRFEGGTTPPPSITTTLASFGWPTDMVDMKFSSSMDSGMVAPPSGSLVLHGGNQSSTGGDGVLANQMVGLGLSSESMYWNQAQLGEKAESSFRNYMLEEDMSSNTSNSVNDFKQLYQPQFSQASSNDCTISNFHVMNSGPGYVGLLLSENQQQQHINYPIYSSSGGYGANAFFRQPALGSGSHLHLTNINNDPFWNASAPSAAMADARSCFFPAHQFPGVSCFDEKPKNTSEVRDFISTTRKQNITEQTLHKRPRNETPSPLPAFKVRKEKMGDRITALQQLVSPFGKTDTASVLSEAFEHIKFLHEQVNALSSPYMKNGAPIHHQQNLDKYKIETEGPRQDLRSRGLCLVPVSSTFPVTHETTVDICAPTFGGSYR